MGRVLERLLFLEWLNFLIFLCFIAVQGGGRLASAEGKFNAACMYICEQRVINIVNIHRHCKGMHYVCIYILTDQHTEATPQTVLVVLTL